MGVFEQDVATGNFLLDTEYSMWANAPLAAGSSLSLPAQWANSGRNNAWERRLHVGWSETRPFHVQTIRWRGRRRLEPNECFGLYTELEATSVNTRTQYWLRTLVSDEG